MTIKDESKEYQLADTEIGLDLQRAMFEMTESKISVKFIKNFLGFDFCGVKIPSTTKNSRLDLPYYIAELLFQEEIIEEFKSSFPISLQELTTAVRKEVRHGEVQPLHPYFHTAFKKLVLEESDDNSPYIEKELKQKKAKMTQITSERLAKLVKMADSANLNMKKMNLTVSEQILMEKIRKWVVEWKKVIIENKWGQTE
ncbi:MAG: hypothetical protein KAT16_03915 [Candidatus Heimdallarchaeota archaeon]|nr:hypothetical protein [Candidatus Heimdallarchaeota archaeon]